MNPLVSVIIPVYKVEKYLDRCVESVINQTYKNLEIILVDDGSPDHCPEICDTWAQKDSRIKVIHKENGGLSDARNVALECAKGNYVFFVDSDDFITVNAVEILVNGVIEDKSEVVISTRLVKTHDTTGTTHESIVYSKSSKESEKALETVFCDNTRWEACGTLFHMALFSNIRFPKGKLYEDFATVPKLILSATKVTFLETELYYYFQRQDSIMRTPEHIVKIDLYTALNENMILFDALQNPKSRRNIKAGALEELLSRVHYAYADEDKNEMFIQKSIALAKRHKKEILFADRLNMKRKVFMFMVMYGISKKIKKW